MTKPIFTVGPEAGGYWAIYRNGEFVQGGYGSAAAAANEAEEQERRYQALYFATQATRVQS